MNKNTRACIAFIVAMAANGGSPTAVFDYSESRSVTISGKVSGTKVEVYDHERACTVTGMLPALYDNGLKAPISLTIEGTRFHGTDYADESAYTGNISGKTISIYDFGAAANFQYRV